MVRNRLLDSPGLAILLVATLCAPVFGTPAASPFLLSVAPGNVTQEPNARLRLERYMADRERRTGFTGAVLIRHGGEVLLRGGFGMANYELRVANSPEMIYQLGSITKPFTSTAVLHAYEAGLLKLADSVCDFLDPCPPGWADVEIRNLLDHTSGIPDLFGAMESAPLLETATEVERVVDTRLGSALMNAPGMTYAYSNFNYMLLGYILERASGTDWESYLQRAVFEPAGLQDTAYDDVWGIVPNRVTGYVRTDGRLANRDYHDHSAYAAGGLHSTLDDVARFHDALVGGRIISRESLDRAMSPHAGNYGYGWQIIEALGRTMYNHTGGANGATAHVAHYPADDLLLVVFNNVERENPKGTACDLARLVFRAEPLPEGTPGWTSRSNAQRCEERPLSGH